MAKPIGTLHDCHHCNRREPRVLVNGIVALTDTAKPAVTQIYDIAPGGVSFWAANELDITESTLEMDILIFDIQTDIQFLINQVTGSMKSKILISDPINKAPTWRYSVEFVDFDRVQQKSLEKFFIRAQQASTQVSNEYYQNSSYGS